MPFSKVAFSIFFFFFFLFLLLFKRSFSSAIFYKVKLSKCHFPKCVLLFQTSIPKRSFPKCHGFISTISKEALFQSAFSCSFGFLCGKEVKLDCPGSKLQAWPRPICSAEISTKKYSMDLAETLVQCCRRVCGLGES
jgi:hypothetical protein